MMHAQHVVLNRVSHDARSTAHKDENEGLAHGHVFSVNMPD